MSLKTLFVFILLYVFGVCVLASYYTFVSSKRLSGLVPTITLTSEKYPNNIERKMTLIGKSEKYIFFQDLPYSGLGNQMFAFAASLGIASVLGYKVVINSNSCLLEYFEIRTPRHGKVENMMAISERQWRNQSWRELNSYHAHNLSLDGFFQAETYFKNVTDKIWKNFIIKPYYLEQARAFLRSNVPGIRTRICVHVRRGDFLWEESIQEGRVVADKAYLNKSMTYFRQKYEDAFFIVISQDTAWCRDNLIGTDHIFSYFKEAILDMAVMSLCDHVIITSGSFGWWGGWLSGGTVIYLEDSPRPGSKIAQYPLFIRNEYYPASWIGMRNGISHQML